MPDGLKSFYESVIKDGKLTADDLGSLDHFNTFMSDSTNAKSFYDGVTGDGKMTVDDLGDWEHFNKYVQDNIGVSDTEVVTGKPEERGWLDKTKEFLAGVSEDEMRGRTLEQRPADYKEGTNIDTQAMLDRISDREQQVNSEIQRVSGNIQLGNQEWDFTKQEGPRQSEMNEWNVPNALMTQEEIGQGQQNIQASDSLMKEQTGFMDPSEAEAKMEGLSNSYTAIKNAKDFATQIEGVQNAHQMQGSNALKQAWEGFSKSGLAKDFWTMGLSELNRSFDMLSISEKMRAGEKVTEDELMAMGVYGTLQDAMQGNDASVAFMVGQGVKDMIPYMASFAATGGVGTAAKGGVNVLLKTGKLGLKKLIKERAWKEVGKQVGKRTLAYGVGAAAQTPLMPMMYTEYAKKATGGNIPFGKWSVNAAQPKGEALWNAFATTYSEVFSERLGEAVFKPIRGMLFKGANKVTKANPNFVKKFQDAAAWDGVVDEYLEELANVYMSNALTTDGKDMSDVWDWKEQIVTLLTVSVMGGGMYAANTGGRLYDNIGLDDRYLKTLNKGKRTKLKSILSNPDKKSVNDIATELSGFLEGTDLTQQESMGVLAYSAKKLGRDISDSQRQAFDDEVIGNRVEQEIGARMKQITHNSGDKVVIVETEKGELYFVKDGEVAEDEDTGKFISNTKELIVIGEDGRRRMISPNDIVSSQFQTPQQVHERLLQEQVKAMESTNQQEREASMTPDDAVFVAGQEFTFDGKKGVVNMDLGDGMWGVTVDGQSLPAMSEEDVTKLINTDIDAEIQANNEIKQAAEREQQAQQDEQKQVQEAVAKKEPTARKLKFGKGKQELEIEAVPQKDGSYIIGGVFTTDREAQEIVKQLNERYKNSEFEAVDITDTNDEFAETQVIIRTKVKQDETSVEDKQTETVSGQDKTISETERTEVGELPKPDVEGEVESVSELGTRVKGTLKQVKSISQLEIELKEMLQRKERGSRDEGLDAQIEEWTAEIEKQKKLGLNENAGRVEGGEEIESKPKVKPEENKPSNKNEVTERPFESALIVSSNVKFAMNENEMFAEVVNGKVIETKMDDDILELQLSLLENAAKKGKLTWERFQNTYFGQKSSTNEKEGIVNAIEQDAVKFIEDIKKSYKSEPVKKEPKVKPEENKPSNKNEVTETKVPTLTPEQATAAGLTEKEIPVKTTFKTEDKQTLIDLIDTDPDNPKMDRYKDELKAMGEEYVKPDNRSEIEFIKDVIGTVQVKTKDGSDLTIDMQPVKDMPRTVEITAYMDGGQVATVRFNIHSKDGILRIGGANVKEDYRRRGIYSAIIDQVQSIADKGGFETLDSGRSDAAQKFWKNRNTNEQTTNQTLNVSRTVKTEYYGAIDGNGEGIGTTDPQKQKKESDIGAFWKFDVKDDGTAEVFFTDNELSKKKAVNAYDTFLRPFINVVRNDNPSSPSLNNDVTTVEPGKAEKKNGKWIITVKPKIALTTDAYVPKTEKLEVENKDNPDNIQGVSEQEVALTPREAAKDLIRVYVERGETFDDLKGSYLGHSSKDFSANIINKGKIHVTRLNGKDIDETFSLKELINEINQSSSPTEIAKEEAATDTNPSDAQIKAGNAKKGHIKVQGLDITIENAKGSTRSGTDENGTAWSQEMQNTYGYFKRTKGKDGDQIDVFLGPNLESSKVFVIDQLDSQRRGFDEHKVMAGFDDIDDARKAYYANYEEEWDGLGEITEVDLDTFKKWVGNGTRKQKPFADYKAVKDVVAETSGENIANPIDLNASQDEKINQLNELTKENKPIIDEYLKGLDAELGTNSKSSIKDAESIKDKANRPYIKKVKPWWNVEHIRDSFRFKTVISDLSQIPTLIEKLNAKGFEIIKPDLTKLFSPKEWGFRFVAFDIRMPNGQIVEYYIPLQGQEDAKKDGNHVIFEKWRVKDTEKFTDKDWVEYYKDVEISNDKYQAAWEEYLKGKGQTESEAFASLSNLLASTSSRTRLKLSLRSSAVKPPLDQTPSILEATKESPSKSVTLPSDKSLETKPSDITDALNETTKIQQKSTENKGDYQQPQFIGERLSEKKGKQISDYKIGDKVTDIYGEEKVIAEIHPEEGRIMSDEGDFFEEIDLHEELKPLKEVAKASDNIIIAKPAAKIKETEFVGDVLKEEKKPVEKKESNLLGTNSDGNKVFEDNRGVRNYVTNGIQVSQKVTIVPGDGIIIDSPSLLFSNGDLQFLTNDEIKAFKQEQAKKAKEEEKYLKERADKPPPQFAAEALQEPEPKQDYFKSKKQADRYAELQRKMKAKLNNLNSGFDPEMLAIGAEMAAIHMEAGARKFADFSKRMMADLGDLIKPYLKSFYNGARDLPGMEEFSKDMDSFQYVSEYDFDKTGTITAGQSNNVRDFWNKVYVQALTMKIGVDRINGLESIVEFSDEQNAKIGLKPHIDGIVTDLMMSNQDGDVSYYKFIDRNHVDNIVDRVYNTLKGELENKKPEFVGELINKNLTNDQKSSILAKESDERDNSNEVRKGTETTDSGGQTGDVQNGSGTGQVLPGKRGEGNRAKTGISLPGDESQSSGRISVAGTNVGGNKPRLKNSSNYSIPNNYKDSKTFSKAQNFDNNIEALRVLVDLEKSGKKATNPQKEKLFKYVGFGGIKEILSGYTYGLNYSDRVRVEKFNNIVKELDPDGKKGVMEAVKSSVKSAHFTPIDVIKGIYSTINRAGFKKGKILEPSMGTGHFFGAMPKQIRENAMLTGVELDYITGKIATHLYPDADVQVTGLQNAFISNGSFDMIVSNIPFGDGTIYDKSWKGLNDPVHKMAQNKVHNYFVVKMLELAKPGGIVAFITSSATLDTPGNAVIRRYMADNAEFLGAMRLPNTTFKGSSGTEVTTDVIFLRKWKDGEDRTQKNNFTEIKGKVLANEYGTDTPVNYNEYFHNKPHMMIGKPMAGGLYGRGDTFVLQGDQKKDILSEMRKKSKYIIDKEVIKTTNTRQEANKNLVSEYEGIDKSFVRNGNIVSQGNKLGIIQVLKSEYETTTNFIETKFSAPKTQVLDFIRLRNTLSELMYNEINGATDEVLTPLRKKLNREYDTYSKKHGRFNEKKNNFIDDDVDNYTIRSLEKYDKYGNYEGKADIFSQITINPIKKINKVDTPQEAVIVSLDEYGSIDPSRMQDLLGEDWYQKSEELIFEDPSSIGNYVTKDEYLTGNVRKKLIQAETALETNSKFKRNVDALTAVIPADIPPLLINIRIGARWVPVDVYSRFMQEIFSLDKTSSIVKYNKGTDKYYVEVLGGAFTGEVTSTYSASNRNGYKMIEDALNDTRIKITWKDSEGKTHFDDKATQAVQEKVNRIKTEFEVWVKAEKQRESLEQLSRIYNDLLNAVIKRHHDGSHMTFPGMVAGDYKMMIHQKDAIWMLLQNNGGVIDHIVGSGKTMIMISAAMEMRRTGVANKPMLVVLKSTVPQVAAEFRSKYPLAKVLSPSEKDFQKKNRHKILSKIAINDWDAVILSHDQYKMLEHEEHIVKEVVREEMDMLDASLESLYGVESPSQMTKRQIKGLQNRKDALKARIQKKLDRKTDDYTFEKMGIDHLFIDESHKFKNLSFTTSHSNVSGLGSPAGNDKTAAMLMGVRALQLRHSGDKGTTFLSGTPISNSMVELYLILRYLRPSKLKEIGLHTFDGWASIFSERTTEVEFSVTGEIKQKDRFRSFTNVPELSSLYSEIADVRNDNNLKLPKPGRTMELVAIKGSENQKDYAQRVIDFAKTGDAAGLNMVMTDNKRKAKMLLATGLGAKLAMDTRLIDPTNPDEETSKINQAAIKVNEIYHKTTKHKGVQLVFSDLGVPSDKFNAYDELKRKLTEFYEIPANEVVFIHSYDTDKKRDELFKKVNAGEIRVMIGSTEKMGTGVNVQERIVAIHHLDVPWKPSDFEQRNGRGVRQGNKIAKEFYNNNVDIYVYALKQSLDSYKYQLLSTKQNFIDQLKDGSITERNYTEGSGSDGDMSYAEFVAVLSDNPILLGKAKVDKELYTLNQSKRLFEEEQYNAKRKLASSEDAIDRGEELKRNGEIEINHIKDNGFKRDKNGKAIFEMTVNGNVYTKPKEAGEAILKAVNNEKTLDAVGYGLKLSIERRSKYDDWIWESRVRKAKEEGEILDPDTRFENRYHYKGESKLIWGNATLSEDPTFVGMSIMGAVKQIERAVPTAETNIKQGNSEVEALKKIISNEFEHDVRIAELTQEKRRIDKELANIDNQDTKITEEGGLSKVSTDLITAVKEVLSIANSPKIDIEDATEFYNQIKDGVELNDIGTKTLKILSNAGLVDDKFINNNLTEYTISKDGKRLVGLIKARIETRKDVKSGNDMFPETSNIPEITNKPLNTQGIHFLYTSPTEDALPFVKQNKATPDQMMAMLLKNGAKKSELDWMGYDEAFKDRKSVTKQEVEQWIKDNKVGLKEVVNSEEDVPTESETKVTKVTKVDDNWYIEINHKYEVVIRTFEAETKEEASSQAIDDFITSPEEYIGPNTTKFYDYQTPGGKKYKEFLLTMPEKPNEANYSGLMQKYADKYGYSGNNPFELISKLTDSEKEMLDRSKKGNYQEDIPEPFKSYHFDEPNIVVHWRTSEFVDTENAKVLHSNEFQSDWAQEGKKKGFSDNEPILRVEIRKEGGYNVYTNDLLSHVLPGAESKQDALEIATEEGVDGNNSIIPNMPFKQTPQWLGLALKRMVQYAAENGFDKVTWNTGTQQVERYKESLQNTVDKVEWEKTEKGIQIKGYKNGNQVVNTTEQENSVSDAIGKSMGDKIINSKEQSGEFTGDEITISSTGMATFYDRIVPSTVNKLFKKYGVKVGETDIGIPKYKIRLKNNGYYMVSDSDGSMIANNIDPSKIDQWKQSGIKVHSITLTPELIKQAMGGFPMFNNAEQPKIPDNAADLFKDEYINEFYAWEKEAELQAQVIAKDLGIDIVIAKTEAGLPKKIRQAIRSNGGEGRAKGLFDADTGKIYVILSNNKNTNEIRTTILHEAVGHKGLRLLFGRKYNRLLEGIYKQMTEDEINYLVDKRGYDRNNIYEIADEFLAMKAMDGTRINYIQKALAKIRQWIRDVFGLKYSNNDINYLFELSRKKLNPYPKPPTKLKRTVIKPGYVQFGNESEFVGDLFKEEKAPEFAGEIFNLKENSDDKKFTTTSSRGNSNDTEQSNLQGEEPGRNRDKKEGQEAQAKEIREWLKPDNNNKVLGLNGANDYIYGFADRINEYLKEQGIKHWMYDQESFTGASHYLNTPQGKIRLSDHGRPSKAKIYDSPLKNVVIHDGLTHSEAKKRLSDLLDFIIENKSKYVDQTKTKEFDSKNPDIRFLNEETEEELTEPTMPLKDVYEGLEDDWIGTKDWENVKASVEANNFQNRIKQGHKKNPVPGAKNWQDVDKAIHVYLDTMNSETDIDTYWPDLNEEQRRRAILSQNLTPEIKRIAWEMRQQYDILGAYALDEGAIFNLLDYYVARSWKLGKGQNPTEFWRKFGTTTKHARKRTLGTVIEGWAMKDKEGKPLNMELAIEGATNNLSILKSEIHAVIENKRLIDQGLNTKDESGNALFSTRPLDGYERVKHPNFRVWKPTGQVAKTDKEKAQYGDRDTYITNDGAVIKRLDIYAPKPIAKRLNNILGESNLKGVPIMDAITRANAALKRTVLSWSFFHHMAFGRSYLFASALKKPKDVNIHASYKEGKENINKLSPEVELLVRNGLTLGRVQDWDELFLKQKGQIGKWLDKHNVGNVARDKIRKLHEDHTNFLFNELGAGLKVKSAILEMNHLRHKYPNMDINAIAKMAASSTNKDFGGLHLERMGRSKTRQHWLRLLLLAPDWTESNVLTMVSAFGYDYSKEKGKRRLSKEEHALYKRFWGRTVSRVAFASIAMNLLLAMFDGGDDDDYWDTVIRRYKDAFQKPERLNWLAIDVTPIYKAIQGENFKPDERKYFSVAGHFKDPYKWIVQAIDGSWTTPIKNKGSIFVNTLFSLFTGTNWRGRRYTDIAEVLGVDDKGVYSTSKKNPDWKPGDPYEDKYDYKVGDPKGGKKKGELTRWASPGESGGVATEAMPSFIMAKMRDWMPIPIQNIVSFAMGEIDAFEAMSHGVGMHMSRNKIKEVDVTVEYEKIKKSSTIYIRRVNTAKKDRQIDEYITLMSDPEYERSNLVNRYNGIINDLKERRTEALNRSDNKTAEYIKLQIEARMQQIIEQYNKVEE